MTGILNRQVSLLLVLYAGLLMGLPACGRKGPPVAPTIVVPASVQDLRAEVEEDRVALTWSIPGEGVVAFEVFKHSASVAEACAGCPIPFQAFDEINLANPKRALVQGNRITWTDPVGTNRQYAYKVVARHKSGGLSGDSNIVVFNTAGALEQESVGNQNR